MLWKVYPDGSSAALDPRLCTADHLVRECDGGATTEENVVAACRRCNNARHWSWDYSTPRPSWHAGDPIPEGAVCAEYATRVAFRKRVAASRS